MGLRPPLDGEAYLGLAQDLLPQGAAWPRDPDAVMTHFWRAAAEIFAGVDRRGGELLDEVFPASAYEMLPDWERVCGLPDACSAAEATTVQERRAALVAKLTARGGQSRAYYIAVAAALGFEIAITEHRPATCESDCEASLDPDPWRFVWEVHAPEQTIREMDCESPCDEPLRTWGNQILECVLNRLKPAHTQITFVYGA